MKDGVGDQTPVARKEAFDNYLNYYDQIWSKGGLQLCQEKQVTVGARRFLLLETDPGERFSNFDFYLTASECVIQGFKDCRTFFSALIKATEVLEMFCVNLFLYPWKKEIKMLKVKNIIGMVFIVRFRQLVLGCFYLAQCTQANGVRRSCLDSG